MIVPNNSTGSNGNGEYVMPNSRRVYVGGQVYADIQVPFREIDLAPTKSLNGEVDVNEPPRLTMPVARFAVNGI